MKNPDNTSRRGGLPEPPRCIENAELLEQGIERKLFRSGIELPASGPFNAQQELISFKQLQYCSFRLKTLWETGRVTGSRRTSYLLWHDRYQTLRDRLVNANLGLVFKLLTRNRYTNVEFEEMRSEGLMALLRAVDSYNPWSGFKFSTYACNSIIRAFARTGKMAHCRQHLWSSSYDPRMEPTHQAETRAQEHIGLITERLAVTLAENRAELNDNEKFVLRHRFGRQPSGTSSTLKAVGHMMNISKERVRQIQASALAKLREALSSDRVLQ
jgi:RNA polymerase sigma factor (sigma-70 family)